jgi:SulP family sulfate permease
MQLISLFNRIHKQFIPAVAMTFLYVPVCLSLAVACGVPATMGIVTAFWCGIMGGLAGGSNYGIIGPSGLSVGILASYALGKDPAFVTSITLFAGIIITIAWFLRLDKYLVFIPASTIQGLSLGGGLMLIIQQFSPALGVEHLVHVSKAFDRIMATLAVYPSWSLTAFVVFAIALLLQRRSTIPFLGIPSSLFVTLLGILAGYLCKQGFIPCTLSTISSASSVTHLKLLSFSLPMISIEVLSAAATLGFIVIIETMIAARVADGWTNTKHRKEHEMRGIAFANIASGLFGGFIGSSPIGRTAVAIQLGISDRIAQLMIALGAALVVIVFLPMIGYLPHAVIAGLLTNSGMRIVGFTKFNLFWNNSRMQFFMVCGVAFICVAKDALSGLLAGTAISLVFFLDTMARGSYHVTRAPKKTPPENKPGYRADLLVYAIQGPLVYINAQSHVARCEHDFAEYSTIIIKLRSVSFVDLDGIMAFDEMIRLLEGRSINVLVARVHAHIAEQLLSQSTVFKRLVETGKVFESVKEAVASLQDQPEPEIVS